MLSVMTESLDLCFSSDANSFVMVEIGACKEQGRQWSTKISFLKVAGNRPLLVIYLFRQKLTPEKQTNVKEEKNQYVSF